MSAKLATERPVALEVCVYCSTCHAAIKLLAPTRAVRCAACGNESVLSPSLWQEILGDADEHSFDTWGAQPAIAARRRPTPWGFLLARWQSLSPTCRSCKTPLTLAEVGTEGRIACGACGSGMETRPVPSFVRLEVGTAMQLYAAAAEARAAVGGVDALPCPRCGQSCVLPPDATATTTCTGCGSVVSVPELLAQSPLRLDRAFWVTFQGSPPRISARLAHQKVEMGAHSLHGSSLLSEAVDHTLRGVQKAKTDRQKAFGIVLLLIACIVGGAIYWRYYTKREAGEDYTFDPRSSE